VRHFYGGREIRDGGKFQKISALASHELNPNPAAMAAAITPPTSADKSQESLTTTSLLSPRQRDDRGHARILQIQLKRIPGRGCSEFEIANVVSKSQPNA
jgi:hypothetical protein